MDIFRVRLNNVDHYQAAPSDLDPALFGSHGSTQRADAPHVPVIRVFGATETGQKVCAHIHGALPYLYIEYRGGLEREQLSAYIQQLRASIDHALAISYRRNRYDGKAVYVAHISLVKGVPFFGYHVGYRFFLKIYLLNPIHMTRFADLLHQGTIMGQVLQPYESHLQYLLQWMCDFNLYGCANIDCSTAKFRNPVPAYEAVGGQKHRWHDQSISPENMLDPNRFPRQSHCAIEVDIRVQDILNRSEVEVRDLHADFLERSIAASPDEKLVRSLAGLWRDETRRRKLRMGLTDPSSSPFPPEVLISMSADPRNIDKGGWIHEDELRQLVQELVEQERPDAEEAELSFETFIQPSPLEGTVQTVLESVTDLFDERLRVYSASFGDDISQHSHGTIPVVVDENAISQLDRPESDYDSDEDARRELSRNEIEDIAEIHNEDTTIENKDDKRSRSLNLDQRKAESTVGIESPIIAPNANDRDTHLAERYESSIRDHVANDPTAQTPNKKRKIGFALDTTVIDTKPTTTLFKPSKAGAEKGSQLGMLNELTSEHDYIHSSKSQSSENNQKPVSRPKTPPLSSDQLSRGSTNSHDLKSTPHSSLQALKNPYRNIDRHLSPKFGSISEMVSMPTGVSPVMPSIASVADPSTKSLTSPGNDGSSCAALSPQLLRLATELGHEGAVGEPALTLIYGIAPPSATSILASLVDSDRPSVIYQDAYYSDEKDVPERARDYAGREFKLESTTTPYLAPFDDTGFGAPSYGIKPPLVLDPMRLDAGYQRKREACNLRVWDFARLPPSCAAVAQWLRTEITPVSLDPKILINSQQVSEETAAKDRPISELSQIEGPTQKNKHGFKFTQKQKTTSVRHETQYMSTMSLEVHVNTRESFVPNPEEDVIACMFWCFRSDEPDFRANGSLPGSRLGILALSEENELGQRFAKETFVIVEEENSELDLINRMVDIVREYDPDILTGFEVHNSSWGYLIERARLKYEYNLCDEFSRMKSQSHGRFGKEADKWGFNNTSTIRVTGRHMINIWRAMRSELNLLQYTMENVAFHLLHKRIPHYSFRDLTNWYQSSVPHDVAKVLEYFLSRVHIDLEILDANELIPRTSEQARLIGVDFFSVFSRGSQFKVESFMFRIAKPENFLLVSPNRKQVGQQNALECLPLVMEPQSAFYNSPLLVLDFQSLYPSIMIAYNYCYSTCLGRIVNWRGQNKLGFAEFKRQPRLLELVKDTINIAPNGIMYVKPEMRKSLLAKMLGEILETRVMVKSGMKVDKDDKTLQQLLNNRQLALKLLANVTYGYTSASFSGRMPCSEIADSIVQTARETLEKAIALIHSVERWNAEVVYGDTDSLFIYLKGRTKDQAFQIGNEIAKAVTDRNPRPMKLKFEKVYFPCVLLAKKRYVGFKYESPSQVEPEFDAKGIETVRRDGTPAEQKIEEKCLKLLFRTADLSQVKIYFQQQCTKVMAGQVSIQDFCFAREVKLGTYADKGPPPPGALISTRRMLQDPRTEPQYGERVAYVVITGAPGARLIDRCVAPEQLLKDDSVELDAEYYISKNLIPPLERIFNLVGANVRQWYEEMPKVQRVRDLMEQAPQYLGAGLPRYAPNGAPVPVKKTLENYMKSSTCVVCRTKLPESRRRKRRARVTTGNETGGDESSEEHVIAPPIPLCPLCMEDTAKSMYILQHRFHAAQKSAAKIEAVCRSCSSLSWGEEVRCDSKDCSVFYSRVKARTREQRIRTLSEGLASVLERSMPEW